MVEALDVLWEDHGDLDISPPEPVVGQQRLRQEEEENETSIGETLGRHLPSTVEDVDVLWEDHGDLDISPLEPLGVHQPLLQEEENEAHIGEPVGRHLPPTVNGVPVTNLMLRNLPSRLTQEALLRFLPGPGIAKYNLLHMPQKARGTPSSGFAFLNFETHQDAVAFFSMWHRRQIQILTGGTVSSSTVINIEVAKCQGLVANLIEWRTAMRGRSMTATLPAVFVDGQRQDFWQYVRGLQTFIHGRAFEQDVVTCILHL